MRNWLKNFLFVTGSIAFTKTALSQDLIPPLEKNKFTKVTSYDELTAYVHLLDANSDLLKLKQSGNRLKEGIFMP